MTQTKGQIIIARRAYRQGQFLSLQAAARSYDVLYITLTRRHKRTPSRADFTYPNLKLTQTEEAALDECILSIDTRVISPIQALVQEIARLLLAERV